ncbi:hypothetical protein GCM10025872_23030 [Barrientosiimonas endolithica]|uniref:Uncharacterized protein n=1 Tax=Barrientosiimonas endolithica TaxID=1535208 RepID=A0ABN6YNR2_9MICO|nr:hypothetical protein GCM10025872_23030 [Barrientosiimonas endolithica]
MRSAQRKKVRAAADRRAIVERAAPLSDMAASQLRRSASRTARHASMPAPVRWVARWRRSPT